ncbi:MAG: hypothetical protein PVI54_10945 [Desulfobacteraceae bacterium]|jgi:hypothetical protein
MMHIHGVGVDDLIQPLGCEVETLLPVKIATQKIHHGHSLPAGPLQVMQIDQSEASY